MAPVTGTGRMRHVSRRRALPAGGAAVARRPAERDQGDDFALAVGQRQVAVWVQDLAFTAAMP